MKHRYFHYLSPKIIPTFPEDVGEVSYIVDVNHILRTRAYREVTDEAEMTVSVYSGGQRISEERQSFSVIDGIAEMTPYVCSFSTPSWGYAEISFEMSEPVFVKIIPEPGYAVLHTQQGSITLNPDMKYANPRTIEQIKHYGKFSMLHSAVYVDSESGSGNSLLLINPYDRPLKARMMSDTGASISQMVAPRTAELVDLAQIVENSRAATVMVTSTNRVITYDVKHGYGDQKRINSLDHLDTFSGYNTHKATGPIEAGRHHARELARKIGIWRV